MAENKKKRNKSEVSQQQQQQDEQETVAAAVAAAAAAAAEAEVEAAGVTEAQAVAAGVVSVSEEVAENSSKKSSSAILNGWLNPPTPGMTVQGNQTANLIPLSPLLNEDSDNDYGTAAAQAAVAAVAAAANAGGSNPGRNNNLVPIIGPRLAPEMMNNSSQLPGLNMGTNLNSYLIGSSVQSIQNQSQQLPPFNSIQNKLSSPPSTHTMLNMSNTNAMVNSVFNISPLNNNNTGTGTGTGTSLIPLLNNSNTLNPSHLFKSSSKNNMGLGSSLTGNTNLLNELKFSSSQYGTQTSTPQSFNISSFSAGFGLGQVGGRDSNVASGAGSGGGGSGPGSGAGTGSGSGGVVGGNGNSNSGISSSILNNIGSFNDSGW
ncbi:hypothetical protein JA1_002803 [Spathaspora sp. JA1]|nr:hypothetical protein JA1_002803 [Spathaspora sp. JA1]